MKQITRNEVKELNSNKVYGFILLDGEFIVNEPDVVNEQAESADKRFSYGVFEEFTFEHDLKNLAYVVLKDESKVSGSTTVEVVGELTEPGENKISNEITGHLNKAKALLIEKYSDSVDVEASKEALKNIKQDFETLEIYANENDTEPQEYEPQQTVKSIIEEMQELTFAPQETSGNDVQVFSDLLTDSIERLIKALGLNEMSLSAESENKPQELALKAQLQDLYLLNDSMVTADPNHIPRYTDGTIIRLSDLVDMNVQALDNIAELIGFELEE